MEKEKEREEGQAEIHSLMNSNVRVRLTRIMTSKERPAKTRQKR